MSLHQLIACVRVCRRGALFIALSFAFIIIPVRAQTAATPAAAADVGGEISGRVIGDDGQPLRFASVSVFAPDGNLRRPPAPELTDAEGAFTVRGLVPGAYSVSAFASGYIEDEEARSGDGGAARLYRPGDRLTLRLIKGGVITGTVTDASGAPLVNARVAPIRVRDEAGRRLSAPAPQRARTTDDRGIYRLYGLRPGAYLVLVGGSNGNGYDVTAYDRDAPTYYPASTRDTAGEIVVLAGQEIAGADIRYRNETGHAVTGTVDDSAAAATLGNNAVFLTLVYAQNGAFASSAYVRGGTGDNTFAFDDVADGDYELRAQSFASPNSGEALAAFIPVSVRGTDVTGLKLKLQPLASVGGRVLLEALPTVDAARPECRAERAPLPQEMLVFASRDEPPATTTGATRASRPTPPPAAPDAAGDFTLRGLETGRYRFGLRLSTSDLYLRHIISDPAETNSSLTTTNRTTITTTATAKAKPGTKTGTNSNAARTASSSTSAPVVARDGLNVRAGERAARLTFYVAAGAASLRGRVVPATEGATLPADLRVYLVPAEAERADDVLRYQETDASRTARAFAFHHLAPGRYYLIARAAPIAATNADSPRPLAWDAQARARLRREAMSAGVALDLAPCQSIADYTLALQK